MANHANRSPIKTDAANPEPGEIIMLRGAAELTQQQAADLVFVTTRSWQKWESGEQRMPPGAWKLFRILLAHPELV